MMRKLALCAACHRLLCRKPRGARAYVAAARGREANACAAKRRLDGAFARTKRLRRRQKLTVSVLASHSSGGLNQAKYRGPTPTPVIVGALNAYNYSPMQLGVASEQHR
jgi:hypothetical protein